jgi:glycine/D-amino acid oxidase-like deaminating enzyme
MDAHSLDSYAGRIKITLILIHSSEYLIIGQGLAGSALALELVRHGKSVQVIDLPGENRCSSVSAGVFNPITGRVPTLTWRVNEVFDCLDEFYLFAEGVTASRFFYPMPMYRPFANDQDRDTWTRKSGKPDFGPFIQEVYTRPSGEPGVDDRWGGLLVRRSGFVDVPAFLKAVRAYLTRCQAFIETRFQFNGLRREGERWRYGESEATSVVFCQGTNAQAPGATVPIRHLKGEVIIIEPEVVPKWIYNRGVFAVPVPGTRHVKVGATYFRDDLSPSVTEAARNELIGKAGQLLTMNFRVVSQEWGMRPTSPDRRPLVGALKEFENLFFLNGLGTKGVSLAPYAAGLLVRHMTGRSPIDREMDLSRYY